MTVAADHHCESMVREADKDRFLATLFAPAEHRPALYALHAFNLEINRIRDLAREPMPGEIRLQWWREVVEGGRTEEAQANPVAAALRDAVARYHLPVQALADLIDAHAFDLYDDPMPGLVHAEAYAAKTAGVLFDLAAMILQGGSAMAGDLARHAGIAYAFAEHLRLFPRHAARRQLFVPLDVLQAHSVNPEDIFAGQSNAGLGAALAEMRMHVRSHLASAHDLLAAAPAAALPAFLPLSLVRPLLQRMEKSGSDPFTLIDVPQWRRQWTLWRAARDPRQIAKR